MAFDIVPNNEKCGVIGLPNGFWNAMFVETPISVMLGTYYIPERNTIHFLHDGFVSGVFNKEECDKMLKILNDTIKTDEYKKHRYFASRTNQMDSFMELLKTCEGFKKC